MLAKNLKKDDIILINKNKYLVTENNGEDIHISLERDEQWENSNKYPCRIIDNCHFTMYEVDWKARLEVAKNGYV
jgi:hypothetical protein